MQSLSKEDNVPIKALFRARINLKQNLQSFALQVLGKVFRPQFNALIVNLYLLNKVKPVFCPNSYRAEFLFPGISFKALKFQDKDSAWSQRSDDSVEKL